MKDIFGNELEVGDTVAFNQPGYKNLVKGEIIKLNPKMVKVKYKDYYGAEETTNEWPQDMVKYIKTEGNNENK